MWRSRCRKASFVGLISAFCLLGCGSAVLPAQRGKPATEEKDLNTEITELSQGSQSLRPVFSSVISNVLLCALCVGPFLSEPGSSVGLVLQARQTPKPEPQPAPKPQPIPFSHKLHAQFVVDCLYCHEIQASGWEMTYPSEAKCLQCHALIKTDSPAIKKLNEYYNEKKAVPWVRIYEVPDYVYFSHQVHLKRAKIDCQACHGPVAEREVLSKEKPTSMQSCIDCHKEKRAPVNCRACHER